MRSELQNELKTKFPRTFVHLQGSGRFRICSDGISCGDGWYELLYQMAKQMETVLIGLSDDYLDFAPVQIKEKFGTLRVYTDCTTLELNRIIEAAEMESETTCEVCGREGVVVSTEQGWLKCLCKMHIPHP